MAVDVAGMLEGGLDGTLRDFVEGYAADAGVVADVVRLCFCLGAGLSGFRFSLALFLLA